jgi:hypothetical protein
MGWPVQVSAMSNTSPSLPPRGELFSTDGASVTYAAIRSLDESQRQRLLAALQEDNAHPDDRDTPFDQRVARAICAVREARGIHLALTGEESLSAADYGRLQQERHDRHDWPPVATVRRWLGVASWDDVLARCHLPHAPVGDSLERNWNHAFDREEAVAAVKACVEELGQVPSWWEYLHWSGRVDVRRRPGRRPRSQTVFDRLWPHGGWRAALAAAGLEDGLAAESVARVGGNGTVVPAGYRYSPEALRRALRQATEELGDNFGAEEYGQWRRRFMDRRRRDGKRILAVPSRAAFYKRYGTWAEAMADACACPLKNVGR